MHVRRSTSDTHRFPSHLLIPLTNDNFDFRIEMLTWQLYTRHFGINSERGVMVTRKILQQQKYNTLEKPHEPSTHQILKRRHARCACTRSRPNTPILQPTCFKLDALMIWIPAIKTILIRICERRHLAKAPTIPNTSISHSAANHHPRNRFGGLLLTVASI